MWKSAPEYADPERQVSDVVSRSHSLVLRGLAVVTDGFESRPPRHRRERGAAAAVLRGRPKAEARRAPSIAAGVALALAAVLGCARPDPLPSWNDTAPKRALLDFVEAVTRPGSSSYVPPAERIAVFDNDGTLWVEQPMYTQLAFVIDRLKALAPMHPEWQTTQPYQSALEGDMDAVWASGPTGFVKLLLEALAGMTSAEFDAITRDWIADATHPRFGRLYTEVVYQPMLEVLAYLRRHDFTTFIVSAGGLAFMRPWTEDVYGIPPERVIGSTIALSFETRNGKPVLLRLPEIFFLGDRAGKPVGIRRHIGRRPIAAFGNSDGDLEMLQWTTAGSGRRLGVIVHHTDAVREYAYDRKGPVGVLDAALDAADENGWSVVDMKRDWNRVFPFDP